MKRTRFWVGVLAAAALLSVGAILLLGRWSGGGHMARIYQDGVLIREIDLDSLSAPLTFTVEFQGRTNTITAQPGRIRVESADCPEDVEAPEYLHIREWEPGGLPGPGLCGPGMDLRRHRPRGLPAQPAGHSNRGRRG